MWEPLSRIGQAIAGPRLLAAEQGLYLPAQLLARRLLRPWPAPQLHPWQCCGAQGGGERAAGLVFSRRGSALGLLPLHNRRHSPPGQ